MGRGWNGDGEVEVGRTSHAFVLGSNVTGRTHPKNFQENPKLFRGNEEIGVKDAL